MKLAKIIAAVLFLAVAGSASGQDLAGAAKKEKERRANLKDKTAATVTNDDLSKVKKKAAVEPVQAEVPAPSAGEEEAPPKPASKPTAVPAEPGKGVRVAEEAVDAEAQRAELKDKYDRAKERLEFLTLKMRSLQQQLYSFNTMQSKEVVQRDIVETNAKLLAATAEEASLKKEFDDFTAKHPVKK